MKYFQSLLIALILSMSIYLTGWWVTVGLKQKYADCSTIAIEALNKYICLVIYVIRPLSKKECDFADLFPSATVTMATLVLVTHFVFNKISIRFVSGQVTSKTAFLTSLLIVIIFRMFRKRESYESLAPNDVS